MTQDTAGASIGRGFKILVAEDEPTAQKFLSIILQNFDFTAEIASDGSEAIEMVRKNPYDLILMDLQMPVMGGVEATKVIRQELHKTMPILALTATEDDKKKCFAAGMNDYLLKPIENSIIKEKILYWLKGENIRGETKSDVEWDKQKAMKELGIPEGLYIELTRGFFKRAATAVPRLEKALIDRDFEKITQEAHFMKGAAGNLRIQEIYKIAQAMEAFAKGDRDTGGIAEQIKALKSALKELKTHR